MRLPISLLTTALLAATIGATAASAQSSAAQPAPPAPAAGGQLPNAPPAASRFPEAVRGNLLRGEYGRYRLNNDLLSYHLDIRVNPVAKTISGKNSIRFRMLSDDNRIQLDLYANLAIDRIDDAGVPLQYYREQNTVLVEFPQMLRSGQTYTIDFYYSGTPVQSGRFGGFVFGEDPAGRPWIYSSCEGQGAALWWPNKDQWRDEVEQMDISVAIPNDLVDVSNGRLIGTSDLGDGYTRWHWKVLNPINNYSVSVNIGHYVHFADTLGDLTLDFYTLPEDEERAKPQFGQAKAMLQAYEKYFGEYPFKNDGYKLIQVPYSGMEHQSAVTYGNRFANGYLERDWTGVGISPKFDFIVIHESAHEYFGNAVSAADVADMWIHEAWATYLESLYVEDQFGYDAMLTYTNGYKSKVENRVPIVGPRGIHRSPPQDQYFKGTLFINTLRSVVDDDARWFRLIRDFYQTFKYRNILTEDVVDFFNRETARNLTPIFNQYLRRTALPALELRFDEGARTFSYRWKADEAGFNMPVKVGKAGAWETITPTASWQSLPTTLSKDTFEVATDLYYIDVVK